MFAARHLCLPHFLAALLVLVLSACATTEPSTAGSRRGNDDSGSNRDIGMPGSPDGTSGRDDVVLSDSTDEPDADVVVGEDTPGDAVQPQDTVVADSGPDVTSDVQPTDTGASCVGQGCECTPATAVAVCGSLPCVDGVCCDSACGGACQSCNLPGSKGNCTLIPAGEDPDDECVAQPASTCASSGTCDGAGRCALHPAGTPCDDGQTCSASDECDGAGTCSGSVPTTCGPGPGNVCCTGSCVDGTGCRTTPGTCADVCTPEVLRTGASCAGCGSPGAVGTCQGAQTFECNASRNQMCQQVTCGGVAYQCTNLGGTWAWRAGGSCDDGNACTHSDTCSAGVCRGTAVTCTSTPCTTSTCNGTASCTVVARAGESCSDGNPCTANDTCNASGVCQAGPSTTCESTACIDRTCDGVGGCLETIKAGVSCDDGDLCTWGEVCSSAGVCQPGTPISCSGADTTCSTRSCNGTASCATTPRNVGGACDDGNPDTDLDVCLASGVCQGSSGCPPPAVACTQGSENRRGCSNARTISRVVAGSGYLIADSTCSARNDMDNNDDDCWDAGNDHAYRLYMREGERVVVRYDTGTACVGGSWRGSLKIFETGGCESTSCGRKAYCEDYVSDHTANYTALHDGWVIIVADGRTAFDQEGRYELTVSLTCRDGNCGCL